ncbi:MAG TPA: hypothetical protein VFS30_00535 [Dehalococcoidia bacterium]|nr:hypothetical protein [Dehalococcoidia bacterium]
MTKEQDMGKPETPPVPEAIARGAEGHLDIWQAIWEGRLDIYIQVASLKTEVRLLAGMVTLTLGLILGRWVL